MLSHYFTSPVSCLARVGSTLVLAFAIAVGARAQSPHEAATSLDPFELSTVQLWEGSAPGAKGDDPHDRPTLTVFRPQPGQGNGTAVIVAPGGAYLYLTWNLEGRQIADWFNARGVTAFVLKYRLGERYRYPAPLEDAQRAVRWVRAHAKDYFVAPDRIGMIGFSAGGHLAAMAATSFDVGNPASPDAVDHESSRPDFLVLGYAWLDAMQPAKPKMIPPYWALLHIAESEHAELGAKYTPMAHVTAQTPPTFLFHTTDDQTVAVSASVDFYQALIGAGVSAELHIFAHGPHGVGLGGGDQALGLWPGLLDAWLRARGLLTPDPAVAAQFESARARAKAR
jgi:acetyl esterase/lipase